MSVATYFERASMHAEMMLRVGDPRRARWTEHPGYKSKAAALITRALTRAMVTSFFHTPMLQPGDGTKARAIIAEVGWGDAMQYQNDVPGRLRTMARAARERGW